MSARTIRWCAFVVAAWFPAAATLVAGQVLVVDPHGWPGFDYADLADAVNAAGPGDTLLLRSGEHPALVIAGKSLTIVGEESTPGVRPTVATIRIENLGPGEHVVVRGVDLPAVLFGDSLVALRHNDGAVIFEDVRAADVTFLLFATERAAFVVEDCARVSLTRCTARGFNGLASPAGQPLLNPAGPGLRVTTSNVFVYGGSYAGGDGASGGSSFPIGLFLSQTGASGVDLVSGTVFLSGVTLLGGNGGNGNTVSGSCVLESSGGPGLRAGAAAIVLGGTHTGGAAGVPFGGCPPAGAVDGAPVAVTTGSVQSIADSPRDLEVTSPAYLGQPVTTKVTGQPGDPVLLLVSFAPNVSYVTSLKGALVGTLPLTVFVLPALGPSGEMSFSVTLPAAGLPPGIEAVELYEQVLVAGATGTGLLSSPSAISVLE